MCAEKDGCDKRFTSLYEFSPYLPSRVWFYDAIAPMCHVIDHHMTTMTENNSSCVTWQIMTQIAIFQVTTSDTNTTSVITVFRGRFVLRFSVTRVCH